MERRIMKGLRLPKLDRHRSDKEPKIGVRKNPMRGERHQIKVMCSWRTPVDLHLNMKGSVQIGVQPA